MIKCKNCAFQNEGLCRFNPPNVLPISQPSLDPKSIKLNMVSFWPRVDLQKDGCGHGSRVGFLKGFFHGSGLPKRLPLS